MSLKAKTVLMMLAGLFAGVLAWMAVGRTGWLNYTVALPGLQAVSSGKLALTRSEVGLVTGGLVGFMLGVADAFAFDRAVDRLRAVVLTTITGMVAGAIALQVGPLAPDTAMGLDAPIPASASFGLASIQGMVAQGMVWAIVGLIAGAMPGLLRRAPLQLRQGAFGGLLGGLAAGFVARLSPSIISPITPGLSTLPSFAFGGLLIGLCSAAAVNLFRAGSLKIVSGPNAGKEYLLAAPVTLIGSGGGANICLTGDAKIASRQCAIEEDGDHFRLRTFTADDPGAANLCSGDEITIGSYRLRFSPRELRETPPRLSDSPAHTEQERGANPPPPTDQPHVGETVRAIDPPRLADSPPLPEQGSAIDSPRLADSPPLPEQGRDQLKADGNGLASEITDRIRTKALAELHPRMDGPRLVCVDGPYKGASYSLLDVRITSIGRGSNQDVALVDDHAASREHALVMLANGVHVVRDVGSANGTLLNGLPLKPHEPRRLDRLDVIVIGRTSLRYEA